MTSKPLTVAIEDAVETARHMEGSVNERLRYIAEEVRRLNPNFASAVERLIARLQESGAGSTCPGTGERMPDFMLPDESGRLVTLKSLIRNGPLVVAFNRGHWCPYCRLNTSALQEVQDKIAALGGAIVGILPDRQPYARELKADAKAEFPLLTDIDNGYAMSLNLVIWIGSEMQALMPGAGVDFTKFQGNSAGLLPLPATFVVGTDGLIRLRHIDPDYRKRAEVNDLVDALKDAA